MHGILHINPATVAPCMLLPLQESPSLTLQLLPELPRGLLVPGRCAGLQLTPEAAAGDLQRLLHICADVVQLLAQLAVQHLHGRGRRVHLVL